MPRPAMIPAIAMLALLTTTPALAQSDDGWDIIRDGSTVTAFAEYSSGQSLAVRCKASTLEVFILGLPIPANIQNRTVHSHHYKILSPHSDALISELGLSDATVSTAFIHHPARTARFFASSPAIKIADYSNGAPVILELPTDPSGVNEALSTCGHPLTDTRDTLPRHQIGGEGLLSVLGDASIDSLDRLPNGSTSTITSCILDDRLRLRQCQTELQTISFEPTPNNLRRLQRSNGAFNRNLDGKRLGNAIVVPGPAMAGDLVYMTSHKQTETTF